MSDFDVLLTAEERYHRLRLNLSPQAPLSPQETEAVLEVTETYNRLAAKQLMLAGTLGCWYRSEAQAASPQRSSTPVWLPDADTETHGGRLLRLVSDAGVRQHMQDEPRILLGHSLILVDDARRLHLLPVIRLQPDRCQTWEPSDAPIDLRELVLSRD